MGIPHKHAELIKAWADGAIIQGRSPFGDQRNQWISLDPPGGNTSPLWLDNAEYRIKPEPKPDVIYVANVGKTHNMYSPIIRASYQDSEPSSCTVGMNVRLTFDGETGKLKKVEMLDE